MRSVQNLNRLVGNREATNAENVNTEKISDATSNIRSRATPENIPPRVGSASASRSLLGCFAARSGFKERMDIWIDEIPASWKFQKKARRLIAKKFLKAYETKATSLKIDASDFNSIASGYMVTLPTCLHELTELRKLEIRLCYLSASNNRSYQNFPNLPPRLVELSLRNVYVDSLPQLPDTLETLVLNECALKTLPKLPERLINLNVRCNKLHRLPSLPKTLVTLDAAYNELQFLGSLPPNLKTLYVLGNKLNFLPYVPESLEILNADKNNITTHGSARMIFWDEDELRINEKWKDRVGGKSEVPVDREKNNATRYKNWQSLHQIKILPQNCDEPSLLCPDELAKNLFYSQLITWVADGETHSLPGKHSDFVRRKNFTQDFYSGETDFFSYNIEADALPPNLLHLLPTVTELSISFHRHPAEIPRLPPNLKTLSLSTYGYRPILPKLPATLERLIAPQDYIDEELRRLREIASCTEILSVPVKNEEIAGEFKNIPPEIFGKILDSLADDSRDALNLSAANSALHRSINHFLSAAHAARQIEIIERCAQGKTAHGFGLQEALLGLVGAFRGVV